MQVRSVSPDPSGQWLASSSDDGTVKLWEVRTGRCSRTWTLGDVVHCVAWCPNASLSLLAAAVDTRVVLLPTGALLERSGALDQQTSVNGPQTQTTCLLCMTEELGQDICLHLTLLLRTAATSARFAG